MRSFRTATSNSDDISVKIMPILPMTLSLHSLPEPNELLANWCWSIAAKNLRCTDYESHLGGKPTLCRIPGKMFGCPVNLWIQLLSWD